MTLLSMINDAQDLLVLPRSTIVVSSTAQDVRTLFSLANVEGTRLMKRYDWQALTTEKTFVSTATEEQVGVLPSDFDRIVDETVFNRTQNRRVVGPLNNEEWQAQKGLTANILTDTFRIRGSKWIATPVPDAGDTYAYEYISKNWCKTSGGTGQSRWAADDDVGVLSEYCMTLGIVWRFKKSKGLDYAEDFAEYEREIADAMTRDGGKRTLNFSSDSGILDNARTPNVPEGDWSL